MEKRTYLQTGTNRKKGDDNHNIMLQKSGKKSDFYLLKQSETITICIDNVDLY